MDLKTKDLITVSFAARLIEKDYLWRWDTQVERDGEAVIQLTQNSLERAPVSLDQLRKRSDPYMPVISTDGEVAKLILDLMEKKVVLGEIASKVMERYPQKFKKWEDALSYAGRLSEEYT